MHKSFALLLTSALALSACAPSLQDAPVGTAVTPPIGGKASAIPGSRALSNRRGSTIPMSASRRHG